MGYQLGETQQPASHEFRPRQRSGRQRMGRTNNNDPSEAVALLFLLFIKDNSRSGRAAARPPAVVAVRHEHEQRDFSATRRLINSRSRSPSGSPAWVVPVGREPRAPPAADRRRLPRNARIGGCAHITDASGIRPKATGWSRDQARESAHRVAIFGGNLLLQPEGE